MGTRLKFLYAISLVPSYFSACSSNRLRAKQVSRDSRPGRSAAASAAIDVADPALRQLQRQSDGRDAMPDFAAIELASTDTDAVTAAKIAQEFASVAATTNLRRVLLFPLSPP